MQKLFIVIFCSLLVLSEGREEGADVVNGVDAQLKSRPFQVSLQYMGIHFGGGSIVNHYYVLTAAHCIVKFNGRRAWNVSAAAGMVDVHQAGQRRYVQRFIPHENFNIEHVYLNDIGLVKVRLPFEFNSNLMPVLLPRRNIEVPANSLVVLSGWGYLGGESNELPDILQQVALQVYDQADCKRRIENNSKDRLYETNLCTFNPAVRTGQCVGDSGGPLTFRGVQVGIASWSRKDPYCGSLVKPEVYTRVSEYVDWINNHKR